MVSLFLLWDTSTSLYLIGFTDCKSITESHFRLSAAKKRELLRYMRNLTLRWFSDISIETRNRYKNKTQGRSWISIFVFLTLYITLFITLFLRHYLFHNFLFILKNISHRFSPPLIFHEFSFSMSLHFHYFLRKFLNYLSDTSQLVSFYCICICFDGVVIATQCTATFLRSIVLPRI